MYTIIIYDSSKYNALVTMAELVTSHPKNQIHTRQGSLAYVLMFSKLFF